MATVREPGTYLAHDDPQLAALDDLDPDDESTVVWVKDGRLIIGEDDEQDDMGGSSPRPWPIEEGDRRGDVTKSRPIGPRMAEALAFIKANPGCCKADVFRNTGVRHDSDGDDPINRLLRRDLVYNLGPSHRYALYAWQDGPDAEDPQDAEVPGAGMAPQKPVHVEPTLRSRPWADRLGPLTGRADRAGRPQAPGRVRRQVDARGMTAGPLGRPDRAED